MFTCDLDALRRLIREEARAAFREELATQAAAASRPELLTIVEVAAVLRVAARTVRGYIKTKKLPSRVVGRRRLVARVDLEKFAAGHVDPMDAAMDAEVLRALEAERRASSMRGSLRTTPKSKSPTNAGRGEH